MNHRISKKIVKRAGYKTYKGMYADWVKRQIDGCTFFITPYIEKLQTLAPDKYKSMYNENNQDILKVITLNKYKWLISSRNVPWMVKSIKRARKRELFKVSHQHGVGWYLK